MDISSADEDVVPSDLAQDPKQGQPQPEGQEMIVDAKMSGEEDPENK